jgi:hypothetical protein
VEFKRDKASEKGRREYGELGIMHGACRRCRDFVRAAWMALEDSDVIENEKSDREGTVTHWVIGATEHVDPALNEA